VGSEPPTDPHSSIPVQLGYRNIIHSLKVPSHWMEG
jgi:hypothetical protein